MSTKTSNYNLVKPDNNEYYDVNIFNSNSDIIDKALNDLNKNSLDANGYGVISGGIVSAQSTPNMTIQASQCTLKTSIGSRQTALANNALTVSLADVTNPRIDIIYVDNAGTINYLAGQAAANPNPPVTPIGGFLLAQINVAAGATSITNANIVDCRKILFSTDWLNAQLSEKANQIDLIQLSNPSLLINGDLQVWQRGISFNQTATGSLYCADRWQFVKAGNVANFSVNKVAGGVKVTNTSSDGVATYMVQTIEVPESLQGKKVTLSYEGDLVTSKVYFNSAVKSGIGGQDLGSSDINSSTKTIITTVPVGTKALSVMLSSTKNEFTINSVKLESGSIATPFVPRFYAEELAICQRYYETGNVKQLIAFGTGYMGDLTFRVIKRTTPTFTFTYLVDLVTFSNITSSVTSVACGPEGVQEIDGNNFVVGRSYRIGSWKADAEIY